MRKKVYVGWKHYNRNYFRAISSAKGGRTRTITRKAGENIRRLLNRKIILIEKWKKVWDVRQHIRGMSTELIYKEIEELTDNTYCMYK